ncbi:DNA cytosine methyltransferase [Nocardia flavorosea]|uniref:DNA cytosine methyltransferase n=1 Tax=Nocardia flavorosea TaxID=53429 RepID=UPI001894AAE0|nr:DNA cytosine methyltransferase [Nocardia flavorosea]MBF6349003.1 DNA cytosine methyltransferase [Nocardia flavorosea]
MTDQEARSSHMSDIRVLDLFAGPGGLDVAAHFLGYRSIGIELDSNACETRYAAGLPTIHADVTVMRETRFDEIPRSVDILTGGPPCQSFSVAGKGAGRRALDTVKKFMSRLVDGEDEAQINKELRDLDDPRTALVLEPLRWIIKALETDGRDPYEVVVLEQVPQVMPLWELYAELLRGGEGRLSGVKYETETWKLKTEEFGVPQTRTRAVFAARRVERGPIARIERTHDAFDVTRRKRRTVQAESLLSDFMAPRSPANWVSMAEALESASQLPDSPVDISRLQTGDDLKFFVVSNYGSGGISTNRGQRQSSEPAFTVTGKVSRNRIYKSRDDYDAERWDRFTLPESGVLQTFPHNFPWSGKDQAQQIGNAVPPLLGMHVLSTVLHDCAPAPEQLASANTWPEVSESTSEELRHLGCGDRSQCPPEAHKAIHSEQDSAP